MPRPKKPRCVTAPPLISAYGPQDSPSNGEVFLSVEELEAIRLSDFEGLDQERAAEMMEVSRQTYGRILGRARSLLAEAVVTGKTLTIGGGHYTMGRRRRRRFRGGRGGGP
jgi:uncharacterized protein